MSEKNQNRLNAISAVMAIAAMLLSPLITYAVASATHGQRILTLEQEVTALRQNKDADTAKLTEILQRLARIESKLERR